MAGIKVRMLNALRNKAKKAVVPNSGKVHVRLTWLLKRKPPTVLDGELWLDRFSGDERHCIKVEVLE